jgi:sugar phosphate isomerase/epimerase
MKLKMMKATWGMEGSLEQQFEQIASAGYAGIESPVIFIDDPNRFKELLKEYNLDFIAQVVTLGGASELDKHMTSFKEQVQLAYSFNPLLIVSHSAKDSMTEENQDRFFEYALEIERKFGIPIGHETHRSRATFTPWTTSRLLKKFPDLKLTADISHWFCVCESGLEDQEEHLALTAERTIHIHGRVGYAEGPQVPHPAAPEYRTELKMHENFWDRVLQIRKNQDTPYYTITPEYGPPGYMHTLPFTNHPVSDLWEVCLWMRNHFAERFSHYEN